MVFGVVGTLYTTLGGIKAVIWTDTLQLFIVVGAVIVSIVLLLQAIPLPASEVFSELQAAGKTKVVDTSFDLSRHDTLWAVIVLTVFYAAAFGTDQDMAQRLLTCKTLKQSIGSLVGAILLVVPITVLFMVVGLLLHVFYSRPDLMGDATPTQVIDDSRKVYPQYLLQQLPLGVRGLAMAGLFAAAMSSLDSAINAMASSAVSDLVKPIRRRLGLAEMEGDSARSRWASRFAVAGMGLLLTLAAIGMALIYDEKRDTLIGFALGMMTFAYAGLMGVFLCVLLTGRGSTVSVVAALIVGACVISCQFLPQQVNPGLAFPYWMALGTAASFAVCFVGKSCKSDGM